ncbi:MAG: hypothetical protein ACFFD5_11620 [Candidatus Thorarchaeota archaeon]
MLENISDKIKKEIFQLVSTPGIEIEDIPEKINSKYKTNLDYEKIMQILSDEYLRYDLDHGRRLCCRF